MAQINTFFDQEQAFLVLSSSLRHQDLALGWLQDFTILHHIFEGAAKLLTGRASEPTYTSVDTEASWAGLMVCKTLS